MIDEILSKSYPGRKIQRDPFTYSALFLALAPATTATFNINIQSDSDFMILGQTYFADIAAAAQTNATGVVPLITVMLTDTGSGRNLFDAAIAVPSLFGNGQFPHVLPQPKLLAKKSTLQVQVTNFDAAATYNLRLYFDGIKIFDFGK